MSPARSTFQVRAGVDTLALATAQTGATAFTNLTSGLTIALGANAAGFADTFTGPTAITDILNVTQTSAAVDAGTLTFNGFETINHTIAPPTAGALLVTNNGVVATPSVGATSTYNLIDNNAAGAVFVAIGAADVINLGTAGVLKISGTGTAGVTIGFFAGSGAITAAAIDASGLNTGALATTPGLTMGGVGTAATGTPTQTISILGSNGHDNLRGSFFFDSISGGAGDDRIDGNLGGDVMSGGAGIDTYGGMVAVNNFATNFNSVPASASGLTATVAAGQTITFGFGVIGTSNIDRITDFAQGIDKMDVVTPAAPVNLFGGDATTAAAVSTIQVLYGNYAAATGVFTAAALWSAATPDALVYQADGATSFNASFGTNVLTGLSGTLLASDFV